jgi:hypothetical protein
VILEEIRSQNRATIEALQASEARLERKIDDGLGGVHLRLDVVEGVVRQNSKDILQNSTDIRQNTADIRQNSADIQALTQRVGELDTRVAGLEQQKA